jgi:thioredoxin 1
VSRQTHSGKRSQLWKVVALGAIVLLAAGIVVLKPRGHSVTEPSLVPSPRTESTTQKSLSQPAFSAHPPLTPEVVIEEKPTKPEPSSPPPAKPEVKPPETPPPQTKLPLLLDIGSTTCIPCKKMAPILEELKEEYRGVVEIKFIEIYTEKTAAREYRIMVIPTQIFYDERGTEFHRHLGFMGKEEILQVFKKMGVEF